jgi:hypothetical protein
MSAQTVIYGWSAWEITIRVGRTTSKGIRFAPSYDEALASAEKAYAAESVDCGKRIVILSVLPTEVKA